VWSLSCRCWCLTVCITWHPAICLPCANRSLITLVVVTYARLRVVTLLFQPQGRSDTVLAASPRQGRPPGTLFQHRYWHLTSTFRRDLKLNCLSERITSTLMTVSSCKSGELNLTAHHHHQMLHLLHMPLFFVCPMQFIAWNRIENHLRLCLSVRMCASGPNISKTVEE